MSKKLISVEKVRQIIEEADDYFDVGDLVSAEPLYSSAIEVRILFIWLSNLSPISCWPLCGAQVQI